MPSAHRLLPYLWGLWEAFSCSQTIISVHDNELRLRCVGAGWSKIQRKPKLQQKTTTCSGRQFSGKIFPHDFILCNVISSCSSQKCIPTSHDLTVLDRIMWIVVILIIHKILMQFFLILNSYSAIHNNVIVQDYSMSMLSLYCQMEHKGC